MLNELLALFEKPDLKVHYYYYPSLRKIHLIGKKC